MIQPLGPRVLIRAIIRSDISAGGIIVGDADPRHKYGQIEAIGHETKIEEITGCKLAIGDTVIVGTYAGVAIESGDEERLLMQAEELLAIIPAPEPWTVIAFDDAGEVELGTITDARIDISETTGMISGVLNLTADAESVSRVRREGSVRLELRNSTTVAVLFAVDTSTLIGNGRLIARGSADAIDGSFGWIRDRI